MDSKQTAPAAAATQRRTRRQRIETHQGSAKHIKIIIKQTSRQNNTTKTKQNKSTHTKSTQNTLTITKVVNKIKKSTKHLYYIYIYIYISGPTGVLVVVFRAQRKFPQNKCSDKT